MFTKSKAIIVLACFTTTIFACESNCVACHPKLIQKNGKMDNNHKILRTCIKCHTKKQMKKVNMGITSCGEDCWKCHDIKKVSKINIKEHKALNNCIKCHKKNKKIFNFDGNGKNIADHKNLIDILN